MLKAGTLTGVHRWQYAVAAFSGCRLVLNMHTDPILAPGPALSPGLRSAGAACTGGSGESAFALTTFLPTLNTDDDNVELDDPGGSWRVETVRRSGSWSGQMTSVPVGAAA